MSQTFSVAPRRRIGRSHTSLSLEELCDLGDVFAVDVDEGSDAVHRLGNEPYHLCSARPGRGFGLSYDHGKYHVRVNTPATSDDWRAAINLLQRLAHTVSGRITGEDGTQYSPESLAQYPWRDDITGGLNTMAQYADSDHGMTIVGAVRPVTLKAASWQHMLTTPDPVASFDQLVTGIQMIDAYDAAPIQIRPGVMPFDAIFALTSEVPTIFPNNPADLVRPGMQGPSAWGVSLLEQGTDTDLTDRGIIAWDTFLSQLPANSRQPIGDGHFLVTVSVDLMRELSVGSYHSDHIR